ncbi:glycosyltransferase [Comamonas sp. GB3 AK4-5]|uniref:glycosyltransferase n=1 Tax=Comamonas sp. GB3 AK4-5 TaxID=3231487 RepID=UPI00351EDEA9
MQNMTSTAAVQARPQPLRLLHFVTGGFSGATQVAVDLCLAAQQTGNMEVLLVLRRKRNTTDQRVQQLREQGLKVQVVSNFLHLWTVWELRKIIRAWKPDVVFAHGFSDHIWGRQAAVAEEVPHVFHVEHNSRERYTPRRLKQALALMPHTQASIGVSEGVRESLAERGFPPEKCMAIPNGIDLARFPEALLTASWSAREPAILMASRFARQKDHATLIRALALLRAQGMTPRLYLAGAGSQRLRKRAEALVDELGLGTQVQFLGNVADLPQRLAQTQVMVLSTHWEGMPLALVEGMAAGCACIATQVSGMQAVVRHGVDGLLVPHEDAAALAEALLRVLRDSALAAQLGQAARQKALSSYGREQMWQHYQDLLPHAGS